MITKLLSTQSVGSTPAESTQRSDPKRLRGDTFESVLAGGANKKAQTSARDAMHSEMQEGETPVQPKESITHDAKGDGEPKTEVPDTEVSGDPSKEISEASPDEEGDASSLERETDLPDEPVEASSDGPKEQPLMDIPLQSTRTDPDSTQGEMLQSAEVSAQVQEAAVKTGSDGAVLPPAPGSSATAAKSDVTLDGKAAARAPDGLASKGGADTAPQSGALPISAKEMGGETSPRADIATDQKLRNSTSVLLDGHREVARQQPAAVRSQAEVPHAALTKPEGQTPGKPVTAELQDTPVRLREMPQTVQAVAMSPTVRAQANIADVRVANPAGGVQTTAQSQSLVANTVLQSTSAVVTAIAGSEHTPRPGEEILTQRGAESFALPQMLAEASVRSGASSFRAETPRHVAQQLAEAVATAGKRNVDVSLNPRELGHVNMRVTTTDVGVTVVINAERPETEDLMRRHIQDLAREFKDMGFSDISFEFGSDAQTGQSGDGDSSGDTGGAGLQGAGDAIEEGQSDLPLSQHLNIAADGLDMRI
ncbi:flagellar hook-length control protein FliK [Tritonibacter scottomollicae]|uniref:Flagellar hook-length control protein FliK n=1 Tax=Tritonibacter scottomollicae TaxID=483013 RepID=A0A2T1AL45_TRISK|nr:flagellar hook-length control protein FliK [Tritonibacter scottomollicae]PRZ49331.1 flagellar hook-length control protein FliK [Tritonibacter scottomollicae]